MTQSSKFNTFGSITYCCVVLGIQAYASYKAISRYKAAKTRAWPGLGGNPPTELSALMGLTVVSLLLMPFFIVACIVKVGNLANDGIKLGRDQEQGPKTTPKDKDKDNGSNDGKSATGSHDNIASGNCDRDNDPKKKHQHQHEQPRQQHAEGQGEPQITPIAHEKKMSASASKAASKIPPGKAEMTGAQKWRLRCKLLWYHFCPVAQTIHIVAAFLLLLPEVLLTAAEVKYGYKSAGE